jgi:hypothetical protein
MTALTFGAAGLTLSTSMISRRGPFSWSFFTKWMRNRSEICLGRSGFGDWMRRTATLASKCTFVKMS